MKPLFILLATLTSLFSQAETPAEINATVLKSFQSAFKGAKEVDWSVSTSYVKAQFALDGQYISAFYTNEGELIALTRNITANQLPVMLQTNLKKEIADFWITELFEISNEEGTSYYVTLEDADSKVVLKSTNNKDWTTYKKSRKV
ncbi:MAG: hypothetical protein JWP88_271 [Flaviaesturariibacter sp.]|nr:hypothetical protein [Flaviaesturariibacter sp.]